MQTIWNRFRENANAIAVFIMVLGVAGGLAKFAIIDPIHQRFDAQDKYINQRFDDQEKYFNQRFDDQEKYFNQRFDAVDQRFDAVDQRFDAIDQRLEELTEDVSELNKLSDRVSRTEGEIGIIMRQLEAADIPTP